MKSDKPVVIIDTEEDAMVCFANGKYIGHDDQVDFMEILVQFGVAERIVLPFEDFDAEVMDRDFLDDIPDSLRERQIPNYRVVGQ